MERKISAYLPKHKVELSVEERGAAGHYYLETGVC